VEELQIQLQESLTINFTMLHQLKKFWTDVLKEAQIMKKVQRKDLKLIMEKWMTFSNGTQKQLKLMVQNLWMKFGLLLKKKSTTL
jgi:hypothetical protein